MTTELENIQNFFTDRRKCCLSVKRIEEEAKIPAKTLAHFLDGRRLISAENIDKLIPILVDFGFKPVASDNQFL